MTWIGPYQLLEQVARNERGAVYRARVPGGGAQVAVKVLLSGTGATGMQRQRFAREAQALRRIRHPNVVSLLDAGESGGCPYLVLEWVTGESLAERLRRGPLAPRDAAQLIRGLAAGLHHCHQAGVLHRDLEPGNVLLRGAGEMPLLTDFGLARAVEPVFEGVTTQGQSVGTPGYQPPEQARGDLAAVGPRSDVFGLGALLFAALTGQAPGEPPRAPSAVSPGIPPELDAICLGCLARDPADRPPDAEAVAARLSAWAGEAAADAPAYTSLMVQALASAALLMAGLLGATALLRAPGRTDGEASTPAPVDTLPSFVTPVPTRGEARERGLLLLDAGDPAQAERELARAVQEDPRDALALAGLGLARHRQGESEQGARDLARALGIDPGERTALLGLIEALLALDLVEARKAADAAVAALPADPQARLLRAELRELEGDLDGARADLDRAVELAPQDGEPLAHRAALLHRAGEDRAALQDIERAVDLAPDDLDYRRVRGLLRAAQGLWLAALEDLDRALADGAPDPDGLHVRGLVRSELGDLTGALQDLERTLELAPGMPEALLERGVVRQRLGQHAAALDDLSEAVRRGVESGGRAPRFLALARIGLGDLEGALAGLDAALEATPDDPDLWCTRGQAEALGDDLARAEQDFSAALERDPDHAPSLVGRAEVLLGRGELALAERDATRAVQVAAGMAEAHWLRARVRRARGRLDEALVDVEAALALDPGSVPILVERGALRCQSGAREAGLADLERAVVRGRELGGAEAAMALLERARVFRRMGDGARAAADYTALLELVPDDEEARAELEELRARPSDR